MSSLYTIAYPELNATDNAFIDKFREANHPNARSRIQAHFTLLYACSAVELDIYLAHVAAVASESGGISFECKYAMLGADDESEVAYTFLVPDKGYSAISLLHDALYRGPMESHLRLDLPYTPHITIGSFASRSVAKSACDALNADGINIKGRISSLHVGSLLNGKFQHHGSYKTRT